MHPVQTIVNCSSILKNIVSHAEAIVKVNAILPQILPEISNNNCKIANISNGTLSLVVYSPAMRHQLRFMTNEILAKAQQLLPKYWIKNVKIYVQETPIVETKRQPLPTPMLSGNARQHISGIIPIITNKKLKLALESLATHNYFS